MQVLRYATCLIALYMGIALLCQEYQDWRIGQVCDSKCYRLNTDDATKPHNRVTNETLCYCGETPEHILVVN